MDSLISHIFIVDDDDISQRVLVEFFDEMPDEYRIEMANDGEDAWAKLQIEPEKFDVILLDRIMPGMDGMAVLQKIKNHPVLTHLPVIFLTALTSEEEVAAGIKAGAHYYLTKPIEFDYLCSVVKTAVHDRLEYRRVTMALTEYGSTMNCLSSATLNFKSVREARNIALLLANACEKTEKVVMGLTELLVNAVEHGNLGITYDEKTLLNQSGSLVNEIEHRLTLDVYREKCVEVMFVKLDGHIEITITDDGIGFEWQQYLTISPQRIQDNHGRGIAMASMMSFDSLQYLGSGNIVKVKISN